MTCSAADATFPPFHAAVQAICTTISNVIADADGDASDEDMPSGKGVQAPVLLHMRYDKLPSFWDRAPDSPGIGWERSADSPNAAPWESSRVPLEDGWAGHTSISSNADRAEAEWDRANRLGSSAGRAREVRSSCPRDVQAPVRCAAAAGAPVPLGSRRVVSIMRYI